MFAGRRQAAAGGDGGEHHHHPDGPETDRVWPGVRVLHQPDPASQPGAGAGGQHPGHGGSHAQDEEDRSASGGSPIQELCNHKSGIGGDILGGGTFRAIYCFGRGFDEEKVCVLFCCR